MNQPKDKIYLSGAIQFAKDPNSWRLTLIKKLSKYYDFFNPMDVILPQEIYDLKDSYQKYEWIYNNIVIKDLNGLDSCNHMFIKLDKACFKGSGTVSEITLANLLNIHMFYILDDIKFTDIPIWTRSCLYNADNLKDIPYAIKFLTNLCK